MSTSSPSSRPLRQASFIETAQKMLLLRMRTEQVIKQHGPASLGGVKQKGPISYVEKEGNIWVCTESKIDFAETHNKRWVQLEAFGKLYFNEDSLFFQALLNEVLREASSKHDPRHILEVVNHHLNKLTEVPGKTFRQVEEGLDARLEDFNQAKRDALRIGPYESLDLDIAELVDNGLLVCRHKGMLAASLIGHLIKKDILPPGTARQYSSYLAPEDLSEYSGHLWALYRNEKDGNLWICDPRWDKVYNVKDERMTIERKELYDKPAIHDMVRRADILDGTFANEFKSIFSTLENAAIATHPQLGRLIVLKAKDFGTLTVNISPFLEKSGIAYSSPPGNELSIVIAESQNRFVFDAMHKALKKAKTSELTVINHGSPPASSSSSSSTARAAREAQQKAEAEARARAEAEARARAEAEAEARIRAEILHTLEQAMLRVKQSLGGLEKTVEREVTKLEAAAKEEAEAMARAEAFDHTMTKAISTVHQALGQLEMTVQRELEKKARTAEKRRHLVKSPRIELPKQSSKKQQKPPSDQNTPPRGPRNR